jgi:predicted enzyme related to lactoylglutathione lyase
MGYPVVHFEVVGPDGPKLRDYYSQLFGWEIDADNEMNYGMVARDSNKAASGDLGIGGGVGQGPEGYTGHVTFYVAVPDVEEALQKAESLGGKRTMGPETIMDGALTFGHLEDPEGNMIGVVQDQA